MNRRQLLKQVSLGALTLFGLGEVDMTQPVSHGYPDWGRQLAASDIVIQNSLGLNLVAATQTSVFFVGNMPYMYVRISSAQSANVGIAWFADAAATISLFGDVITTVVGGEGTQCIPVRGPYVRFTLERGAYPGTVNFQAIMVSNPFNVYAGNSGDNVLIEVDNGVVNAGITNTTQATSTRGGWVHWDASMTFNNTFIARLFATDFFGVTHLLDVIPGGANVGGGMVLAPALPLSVSVQNVDAANHNYFVSVTHHPFYP